jgi:hypothetical protein
MRRLRMTLSLVVLLAVILPTPSLGIAQSASPAASPPATPQQGNGCTIQDTSTTGDLIPSDGCTVSDPWWWSYTTCEQTPIETTPWSPPADLPQLGPAYRATPWLALPSEHGEVIVMLWFGSRPVPVKQYADRHDFHNVAAITIIFPQMVKAVSLDATSISAQMSFTFPTGPNRDAHSGQVWNVEMINPPVAGCWDYTIEGVTEGGETLSVPFTFVVVQ